MLWISPQYFKIPEISRIRKLVQIDDSIPGIATGQDIAGSDKPGTAGHKEKSHIYPFFHSENSVGSQRPS